MKRSRTSSRRLGPAAAAMRRHDVYRDGRQAEEQISVNKLFEDAVAMQQFHSSNQSGGRARVMIHNREELALYRQKRRAELEEGVKRGYKSIGNWTRYARWEAQQRDFDRMRAVMERAVAVHGDNANLWRDYAELEELHGHIEHARRVWGRGITALPSSADLWLKYLAMEQAAGQEQRIRDVFNRWLAVETVPNCAYELYALYEAQQQQRDGCREVLRRYVERYNTPTAWLLYSATEQQVFCDHARAVKVLQTALQALPDEVLWGPEECRVPIALAEALVTANDITQARLTYQHTLERVAAYPKLAEQTLLQLCRFERLHGDGSCFHQVARLRTIQLYEERLRRDASDFDAYLTLYILYREQEDEGDERKDATDRGVVAGSSPSLAVLKKALKVAAKDPYGAQQRAVLVMEYARRCEAADDVHTAQTVLANELKSFPFAAASCPRLWQEAAALEERHGDLTQARRLLRAGSQVTKDVEIFAATVRLEERALEAGGTPAGVSPGTSAAQHAECLNHVRAAYQATIQAFPLDVEWWLRYIKFEERQQELQRADALYVACIATLNGEASRARSFTQRYDILGGVDAAWARRIALQSRCLRQAKRRAVKQVGMESTVEDHRGRLVELYGLLLADVWAAYRQEALEWREKFFAEEGSGPGVLASMAPSSLPSTLTPAVARWSEAIEAVSSNLQRLYISGDDNGNADAYKTVLRNLLKSMVETERVAIRRALGWTEQTTSFDAVQQARQWSELLLSPLLDEWSKFEALHGGNLEAVSEVRSKPTKRRTRLFKGSK